MFVSLFFTFHAFFFFKQKTAYEMRISDWSSDVCSSDLCQPSVIISAASSHTIRSCHPGFMRGLPALPAAAASRRCRGAPATPAPVDRKSAVEGKSVSVRVDLGGRRIIKKKNKSKH